MWLILSEKTSPGTAKGTHRPALLPGTLEETLWVLQELSLAYFTCPDCQGLCSNPPDADEEGQGAEMEGISLSSHWKPRGAGWRNPSSLADQLKQRKESRLPLIGTAPGKPCIAPLPPDSRIKQNVE